MVMVCRNLGPGELQFMVRLTTTVAYATRSHGSYSEWSYTVVGQAYASFRSCGPDYESQHWPPWQA